MYQAGASDEKIIKEIYVSAFVRYPAKREVTDLKRLIEQTPTREQALRDLQWAVISSREFSENH